MPAPTRLSDVTRKALQSTVLIHDIDAIDSVTDLSTVTPGTAAATRNLEPRHVGVAGQAPTLQIVGTGVNQDVTVAGVVWGVDSRLITIGVPWRFNAVTVGVANPVRLNLGVCFTEVQGWAFQVTTAISGSLTTVNAFFGYDLDGPVVLLCDTNAQATRPTMFVQNLSFSPLTAIAAGSITSQKRHTRWNTGKPTATTSSAVFMVHPAFTVA